MRPWLRGALGLMAGAVLVAGYRALRAPPAPLQPSALPAAPPQASRRGPNNSLTDLTHPAATVAPSPAAPAATPLPTRAASVGNPEREEFPEFLLEQVEAGSGSSGIKEFHALLSREPRDPVWAPATEYRVQSTLQELMPELQARMHFFQVRCGSTMCELAAVFDATDAEQAHADVLNWQQQLQKAASLDSWKGTGLSPPEAALTTSDPSGRAALVLQFSRAR